jgi:cold-inducible RNA-binding protein
MFDFLVSDSVDRVVVAVNHVIRLIEYRYDVPDVLEPDNELNWRGQLSYGDLELAWQIIDEIQRTEELPLNYLTNAVANGYSSYLSDMVQSSIKDHLSSKEIEQGQQILEQWKHEKPDETFRALGGPSISQNTEDNSSFSESKIETQSNRSKIPDSQEKNRPRMKLYVGNLSFQTSSDDLQQLFSQAGTVESASVIADRETGRSRGFGFVEMATREEGEAAIEQFNGKELEGRNLTVNEAKPREGRSNRGGSQGGFGGSGRSSSFRGGGRSSYGGRSNDRTSRW